jgi:adenine-specific DNA-methyltransferase
VIGFVMPEIKQPIKQLFSSAYNQASWKQFLGEAFADAQLLASPEVLTGIDTQVAAIAKMLGFINLDENGVERQIAVYEVTLAEGIILERNRVGLRNVLRKYWRDIDAALIVYHRPESRKWRLTYVSELRGFGADGESVEIKTEPKRYTYVLGEGETVRTAVSRFQKIQEKGRGLSLDDVKDAFSVEKLSKMFFDEYKKHYAAFCNHMVADPFSSQTIFKGDEKGIRDFSKKLLGRIVFLYFIQKKGWLGVQVGDAWGRGNFNFLTDLFKRNQALFYEQLLSPLFFDTLNTKRADDVIELVAGEPCRIPYLNGGLFEEDDPQHRHLVFPVNLFENLFEFFNQYNFTIYEDDPNDHTVAVDPEMLGHIFENLLEDNKDKGAFYTPKEIVHYMCQESLIEYLTTWFENNGYRVVGFVTIAKPEQPSLFSENTVRESQLELEVPVEAESNTKQINRVLIEKLLKKTLSDDERLLVGGYADKFNVALDAVKICDPAIGSGAFPMGLLHEIFTAKQTLYGIVHGNANGFAASEVKLNIIQNSIYGVDIERGAVDIARLRFWLSLIVDESEPKPLPNLDYKIVVGNSLVSKLDDQVIDLDWNLDETAHGLFGQKFVKQKASLLCDVSDKQKQFFSPDSDKKRLAVDIRNLKIDLLINQLELMVKTRGEETKPTGTGKVVAKQTQIYLDTLGWKANIALLRKLRAKPDMVLNFFDWKLDFPEVMNERVSDRVGFDIVIGNPPYVFSRDNLSKQEKDDFNRLYKLTQFKINLYILFIEKGYSLMNKASGVFSYITPNNWLTLETNSDLRQFILSNTKNIKILQNYANVFESASVDTVVLGFKNNGMEFLDYLEWVDKIPFLISKKSTNEYLSRSKFIISNETESSNSFLNKLQLRGIQLQTICDVKNGVQAYTVGEGSPFCTEQMKKNRVYHSLAKIDDTWVKYLDGVDVCRYSLGWSGQYIKYGKNLSRPRQENLFVGDRILVRQIPNKLPYCINACFIDEHTINDNNSMIIKLVDTSFSLKYIAVLNHL